MRTTTYISDYFTLPMPRQASSRQDYLRKLKTRRILWALLPYALKAIGLISMFLLIVAGLTVCVLGLGG